MKPAEPRSVWRRILESFRKSYNQLTGKPQETWYTVEADESPPLIAPPDVWEDSNDDGIPYVAGLVSVVRPDGLGFSWAVRSGGLVWFGVESSREEADKQADEVLADAFKTAIQ